MGMFTAEQFKYLVENGRRAQEALDRELAHHARQQALRGPRRAKTTSADHHAAATEDALKAILGLRGCFLCVDPSISACGWAIVSNLTPGRVGRHDSGCWHPSAAKAKPAKWVQLYAFLAELVRIHEPTAALVEAPNPGGLSRGRGKFSVVSAISYGRAMGLAHAAVIAAIGDPARVVIPTVHDWKKTAKKGYTLGLVSSYFKCHPADENEADALGIGLWFCNRSFERRTPP